MECMLEVLWDVAAEGKAVKDNGKVLQRYVLPSMEGSKMHGK